MLTVNSIRSLPITDWHLPTPRCVYYIAHHRPLIHSKQRPSSSGLFILLKSAKGLSFEIVAVVTQSKSKFLGKMSSWPILLMDHRCWWPKRPHIFGPYILFIHSHDEKIKSHFHSTFRLPIILRQNLAITSTWNSGMYIYFLLIPHACKYRQQSHQQFFLPRATKKLFQTGWNRTTWRWKRCACAGVATNYSTSLLLLSANFLLSTDTTGYPNSHS